ncbi:MAG TPA: energy transducer TonB [Edaphobacter sp.]|jgi:TonB family protein|nr:energy transducer TonB [Edaphobacter sp.]
MVIHCRLRAAALLVEWMVASPVYATAPPVGNPQIPTSEVDSRKSSVSPRPNPDAAGIYHAGDGVTEPKLISSVVPEFSDKARKRKLSGSIILQLVVAVDGHVEKVQVIKSAADNFTSKKDRAAAHTLDQKAIDAVSQYRFQPGIFEGKPVPTETPVKMNFQMF